MLYAIDGTGDRSDNDYANSMAGSFCRRLIKTAAARYYRGPPVEGMNTFDIADAALADVLSDRKNCPNEPIFLAGHSRGGAAVIDVASRLKKVGVTVKAMFLYDAVDRTVQWSDLQTIPANVQTCYHARRKTTLSDYYAEGVKQSLKKLTDCMDTNGQHSPSCQTLKREFDLVHIQDIKMKRAMRSATLVGRDVPDGLSLDFGNCGTSGEAGCKYVEEFFLGSHGAIGGAPIIDATAPALLINSDRAAIASVAAWMGACQASEGLFAQASIARAANAVSTVERLLTGRVPKAF